MAGNQRDEMRLWKTHTVRVGGSVEAPEPDDNWSPRARQWYLSLCESAPALEYEPSDWATALAAADLLTYCTVHGRVSAQHWAEFVRLANSLFATPDARRRAKIEVAGRDDEDTGLVSEIDAWRASHGL
jgi:hypothetical protein